MATFKQNTAHANGQLSTLEKASEGFGQRDETVLGAAFPGSPYLYGDSVAIEAAINDLGKEIFQGAADGDFVTTGNVTGAEYWGTIDHNGSPINVININYANVPNVATNDGTALGGQKFGDGKGAPETPYVPPLTSPGEGSHDAGDQPGLALITAPTPHDAFGSGDGHANPSDQTIKDQTIGSYTKGDS